MMVLLRNAWRVLLILVTSGISWAQSGTELRSSESEQKFLVEILVEPHNGNIIFAAEERRTREVWAEMLIRGTSGLQGVPFDPALYAKYYERKVIKASSNVPITVPAYSNFRQHQSQPDIVKAWDKPRFEPLPWEEMWADLESSSLLSAVPRDSVIGLPLWARWPWGVREWQEFVVFEIDSVDEATIDSIKALKVVAGNDTLIGWQALRVDWNAVTIALGLNQPLYSIISDSEIPMRDKVWLEKHLKNSNISNDTPLIEAIRSTQLPNQFLRLNRNKVDIKWLRTR